MSVSINVQWDKRGIAGLETGKFKSAVVRAPRKASALRDMRSEASSCTCAPVKRAAGDVAGRALYGSPDSYSFAEARKGPRRATIDSFGPEVRFELVLAHRASHDETRAPRIR